MLLQLSVLTALLLNNESHGQQSKDFEYFVYDTSDYEQPRSDG